MADRFLGVDIGSRTTKLVELEGTEIAAAEIFDTTHDSMAAVRALAAEGRFAAAAATGYGRHLMTAHLGCRIVTEITACARGLAHVRPGAGLVVDVGGQDSKVIALAPHGGVLRFEMNDRCAAGTGRFLEVMARVLGFSLDEFGREALAADRAAAISSMCTVFAESEVVSLLTSGEDRRRIALGLHRSVVDRLWPLAARFDLPDEVAFVGGVALNPAIAVRLGERLSRRVFIPDRPQLVAALGAALISRG